MFGKKCWRCGEKIDKIYDICPVCIRETTIEWKEKCDAWKREEEMFN